MTRLFFYDLPQIYDLRNKNFREGLEEEHPSLDGAVKRRDEGTVSGAENVAREMDEFNRRFAGLEDELKDKILRAKNDENLKEMPDVKVSMQKLSLHREKKN